MIKIRHELKNISEMESTITKSIVDFKMRIVNSLGEDVTSLNRVAINRNNGYLKIETRNILPDELINCLENDFNISLAFHGKVAVETNELYNYIFKPN